MSPTTTASQVWLPDHAPEGSLTFELSIGGLSDSAADHLAALFRSVVQSKFDAANPLLSQFYELDFEVLETWTGSKHYRKKVKFKTKKPGGFIAKMRRALVALLLAKQMETEIVDIVEKAAAAVHAAAAELRQHGHDIVVEKLDIDPKSQDATVDSKSPKPGVAPKSRDGN